MQINRASRVDQTQDALTATKGVDPMAQAKVVPITAALPIATSAKIIDLSKVRRIKLLRDLWDQHNQDGSAR